MNDRRTTLEERLKAHPLLRERIETLLDIAEKAAGNQKKADEMEQRIIDGLRRLGNEASRASDGKAAGEGGKTGKALGGIRVLDIAQFKAGPTSAQILADMGAEVIRVERPGGNLDRELAPFAPNGRSLYLSNTCRNKKGITLELGTEKGEEIFRELVMKSDIVIENFGPVENRKKKVDYNALKQIKKDIIVVSVSAFGQDGPYAKRLGFDAIAQAMSGLMWVTGFPEEDKPVRLGVSFIDTAAGVYGALGALLALRYRDNTGKGQLVDISLLDTAVSFTESVWSEFKIAKQIRPKVGNANVLTAPYDAYNAKDGWVFIGTATDRQWKSLCKVAGRPELASDHRFLTIRDRCKPESVKFLTEWLSGWIAEKTVDEVVEQLNGAGIPCGPVNTVPQAFSDPQIRARNMIFELDCPGTGKIPLVGIPVKLSETPGEIKTLEPAIGEHNEEVYADLLGLMPDRVAKLREEGVI